MANKSLIIKPLLLKLFAGLGFLFVAEKCLIMLNFSEHASSTKLLYLGAAIAGLAFYSNFKKGTKKGESVDTENSKETLPNNTFENCAVIFETKNASPTTYIIPNIKTRWFKMTPSAIPKPSVRHAIAHVMNRGQKMKILKPFSSDENNSVSPIINENANAGGTHPLHFPDHFFNLN